MKNAESSKEGGNETEKRSFTIVKSFKKVEDADHDAGQYLLPDQQGIFESAGLFKNLVENIPGVYWVNDLNTRQTLYISPSYETIWGRRCEDLYKNPADFIQSVHPDDLNALMEAYHSIGQRKTIKIQYRILRPDGNIRWIAANGNVSTDSQGHLIEYGYAEDITDRKQVEEEHKKTLLALERAQKISKTGSFELNLENFHIQWSEEHYRIFEMDETPANQLWERCREKIHPDDLAGLDEAVRIAVEEGRGMAYEHRIVFQDGRVKYLLGIGETFTGSDGKTRMLRGSVQDITEQKTAELMLAKSEQHLRAILDAEPECVKLVSLEGKLLEINAAGLAMLEADDIQDLQSMELVSMVTPNHRKAFVTMAERVFAGQTAHLEFEITGLKGTQRWLETNAVPMRDEHGKINALLSVTRDVTGRKAAENRLKLSQQQLLEAQKIARIGNYTYDFVTGIWHCSEVLDEISGLDTESILRYDKWIDLIAPDQRDYILSKINPLIERGQLVESQYIDCKIIRANDGAERWVSIVGEVELDSNGQPILLKGTVQDVTERKMAEEEVKRLNDSLENIVEERTAQLQQANRELETFNYTVSHDLQNPLRSINGFSKLLLKDYADKLDDEGREYLTTIESAARRMSALVRDLLSFARLGKISVAKTKTDMNRVVSSVVEEVKSAVAHRDVEIIQKPLKADFCDPALMKVVWDNLINNAVKYSANKPNPKVEVGMKKIDGRDVYYVKDNGAGFEMKDAGKLFKVFERLHKSSEFEGTGVGLATVERIVSKHGGKIWAEAAVNKGAVFYFSLPEKPEVQ